MKKTLIFPHYTDKENYPIAINTIEKSLSNKMNYYHNIKYRMFKPREYQSKAVEIGLEGLRSKIWVKIIELSGI